MKPTTVEIVFLIDTSESMRPCIEGLSKNLDQLILPFQGYNFKLRFGLLGYSIGKTTTGGMLISSVTLDGDLSTIYTNSPLLFTDNAQEFSQKIKSLTVAGDENHLLALDCAFDFPFGPVHSTRRVVCLFSDEKIEDGMIGNPDPHLVVEKLCKKAMARKILLYMALPGSALLDDLAAIPCAQIEPVIGGDGLKSINFSKLLSQMGKSISVSSLQGNEGAYDRAIHGQDNMGTGEGSFEGMR